MNLNKYTNTMNNLHNTTLTKERLNEAKKHLINAFLPLLDLSPNQQTRWMGTKTDLLEMTHLIYETGEIKDEMGRPATFLWLVRRVCNNLHVSVPCNPNTLVSKAMQRKNVQQAPLLERYGWQLFNRNNPEPLNCWLNWAVNPKSSLNTSPQKLDKGI